jgi:deoxyribodipyrimidine photo-lyase
MSYSIVWFKRDLRLADHAALAAAARRGPVLCLYIVEPSLWAEPDAARQHYEFIRESLREVYRELRRLGGCLHVVTGEVLDVLARLHATRPFSALYAHEETGNRLTYARDLAVGRWCKARGVGWHEFAQFGVVRRLADRDHWQAAWEDFVARPLATLPDSLSFVPLHWPDAAPPAATALGLDPWQPPQRQIGGRPAGLAVLADFLEQRSGQYRGGISSPLSAPTACSRLSPYLAYGCLSLREVVQATRQSQAELPAGDRRRAGLAAFISRLYWHCHFIQKLESEPRLETTNLHRGYDGLRENDWQPGHFSALLSGRTGWPLVDACVAMLRQTGWINFRMRAMLVSVAAYPLWLHWRPVGLWLAREFLDYEPGIHWSQMQMQSGTTGSRACSQQATGSARAWRGGSARRRSRRAVICTSERQRSNAPGQTLALRVCGGGRSPALLGLGMEQPFPAPRALAPIPPRQTLSRRLLGTRPNIPRIYNPLKQARDHDPRGHFVRRWLPHLRTVPDAWIFEPWRMPAELRARHGLDDATLPTPPVDLEAATRAARERLFALRARPEIKAAKAAIVARHGSRKRSPQGGGKPARPERQLSLF